MTSLLERYMAHVVLPMSQMQCEDDLLSWRNFGLAHRPFTRARDPRLCSGLNQYGHPCMAWGCFKSPDGRVWCRSHRVHEAERR